MPDRTCRWILFGWWQNVFKITLFFCFSFLPPFLLLFKKDYYYYCLRFQGKDPGPRAHEILLLSSLPKPVFSFCFQREGSGETLQHCSTTHGAPSPWLVSMMFSCTRAQSQVSHIVTCTFYLLTTSCPLKYFI